MCTGILTQTKDGNFIFGRTLEFDVYLKWKQISDKNLIATKGSFMGNKEWFITDGLNRYGLFVATFYFPHYHKEHSKYEKEDKINVKTIHVNEFLLNRCKSVQEVKEIASKLNVLQYNLKKQPLCLHWFVCDKQGNCVVLEVEKEIVKVYNNPYNVLTNSPRFIEQEKNVKRYRHLSKYNKPNSISQGSGALGLPGDTTSLSRFVRANFYRKNMVVQENSKYGIEAVLRILHNFDIPLGSVENKKDKTKEVTEYTVAYNLNNMKVKYAPYGYVVDKNGNWKQTDCPVKLLN